MNHARSVQRPTVPHRLVLDDLRVLCALGRARIVPRRDSIDLAECAASVGVRRGRTEGGAEGEGRGEPRRAGGGTALMRRE